MTTTNDRETIQAAAADAGWTVKRGSSRVLILSRSVGDTDDVRWAYISLWFTDGSTLDGAVVDIGSRRPRSIDNGVPGVARVLTGLAAGQSLDEVTR